MINGFGGCPMSKRKLVSNLKTGNLLSYLNTIGHDIPELNMQAYEEALDKAKQIFPQT